MRWPFEKNLYKERIDAAAVVANDHRARASPLWDGCRASRSPPTTRQTDAYGPQRELRPGVVGLPLPVDQPDEQQKGCYQQENDNQRGNEHDRFGNCGRSVTLLICALGVFPVNRPKDT